MASQKNSTAKNDTNDNTPAPVENDAAEQNVPVADEGILDELKGNLRTLARKAARAGHGIDVVARDIAEVLLKGRAACFAPVAAGKNDHPRGFLAKGSTAGTCPDWGGASTAYKSWARTNLDVIMADELGKFVAEVEDEDERAIELASLTSTVKRRIEYRTQTELRKVAPADQLVMLNLDPRTQAERQRDEAAKGNTGENSGRSSEQAPRYAGLVNEDALNDTANPFDLEKGLAGVVALMVKTAARVKTEPLTPADAERIVKHAERIASLASKVIENVAARDAETAAA